MDSPQLLRNTRFPLLQQNFAFAQIDAGGDTTCALAVGGAAFCWGDNSYGQVGTNFLGLTSYSQPQAVMGGHSFTRISSGSTTTCGLSAVTGSIGLFCWGLAVTGNTSTFTPTLEVSSAALTDVSVGNGHVCTTAANALANEIDCSGMDNYGQLGVNPLSLGTTNGVPFSTPLSSQVFSSLGNFASRVSAGGGAFGYGGGHAYTCADQANGAVECVGNNEFGQLGQGYKSYGANYLILGAVGHGQPLLGVTTGMSHACAIDPNTSNAWCWGSDDFGEVGNGYFGNGTIYGTQQVLAATRTDWTAIGIVTFRSLAAGISHTCGIGTDNHIYCWGDNSSGQLGVSRSSWSAAAHPLLVF